MRKILKAIEVVYRHRLIPITHPKAIGKQTMAKANVIKDFAAIGGP